MKRFIKVFWQLCFVLLLLLLTAAMAQADCSVTINWTPSVDTNAASQSVFYDPDNAVPSNEIEKVSGLPMTTKTYTFNIPVGVLKDEVYVRTSNADGTSYSDSPKKPVGGISGASAITTITICQ